MQMVNNARLRRRTAEKGTTGMDFCFRHVSAESLAALMLLVLATPIMGVCHATVVVDDEIKTGTINSGPGPQRVGTAPGLVPYRIVSITKVIVVYRCMYTCVLKEQRHMQHTIYIHLSMLVWDGIRRHLSVVRNIPAAKDRSGFKKRVPDKIHPSPCRCWDG
ncbi:hypothetical protein BU24DRAFT_234463 [Aaosphaeria arxii CBS 175.79]|uniref:Uncharacterized protein n=1 Tax=Aaosphaeria arxii CBS 175.79 TaxID=1450172 RepID=A0A6A5XJ49_9PLEO|nr:uncharacterized protein BU24DRAFT_234463 [Aaosphaeria arxii CBS 175.79]KAF2013298.1 hypothetical protein BU24DRAFT_234463 [Aaosphaeria arxii CBS 175.79]